MAITASVGELVIIQFPVFDVDGITPVSGLVDGDFSKMLLRDNVSSPVPITVSEVGATGRYVLSFTPNLAGLWYAEVETPFEDIFAENVETGPPPQDWVTAIWTEPLPGAYPVGSAGERLASTDDRVEVLEHALIMAVLSAGAGSTADLLKTGSMKPTGFYDKLTLVVRSSSGNVARRIKAFTQPDGSFELADPLPFNPTVGDEIIVLGILGEVVCSDDSACAMRLREIWQLLGLDEDNPLCITKSYQQVNGFRLTHTTVGERLIVQREDL